MKIYVLVATYVRFLYCLMDGRMMLLLYSQNLKKHIQSNRHSIIQFDKTRNKLRLTCKFNANLQKKTVPIPIPTHQSKKAIPIVTHF